MIYLSVNSQIVAHHPGRDFHVKAIIGTCAGCPGVAQVIGRERKISAAKILANPTPVVPVALSLHPEIVDFRYRDLRGNRPAGKLLQPFLLGVFSGWVFPLAANLLQGEQ